MSFNTEIISLILQGLKYVPEFVEVGKDVWKKLKPPAKLAADGAQNGIRENTYYSGDYKFQISIPDDSWSFWQPTPEFIASLGVMFALPIRAIPIMILSKNTVKLYRPMIYLIVEDVGSLVNVQEMVKASVNTLQLQGYIIEEKSIRYEPKSNSAAFMAKIKNPSDNSIDVYTVIQVFLCSGKAYTLNASYAPYDTNNPQLFGGMQEILNSFKLIK